ncbi:MAG: hypothetical protein EPN26_00075 [Rhodospirillales bacterium]|nr:MAG: hypothetical protein EPN26_00075 [Rhodospirillales bacterium]
MSVPEWDDSYRIGLPVFDNEHKELMSRIGSVFRAVEAGEATSEVVSLIDDLLERFFRHIAWEEKWMECLITPAGVEHRNLHKSGHRELISRTALLRERFAQGGDGRAGLEDLAFLLTLSELIQLDYEMVGLLRREGYLSGEDAGVVLPPEPSQPSAGSFNTKSPECLGVERESFAKTD